MNISRKITNGMRIIRKSGPATLWNTLLMKYSKIRKPDYCYAQPVFAQIEITTYCNLRCNTCREFEDGKIAKHMSFEKFANVISKLPHLLGIRINGVGEPLMNPDLPEMITYAANRGINVHFFSNGTLLKGNIPDRLLKSGLNGIIFSIDGSTSETFDKIRKGAKLTEVTENISNFIKMINESGVNSPVVTAITTISKDNITEVPQIVELVHSMGIRNMMIKRMIPWIYELQNKVVSNEELITIKKAKEVADKLSINLNIGKLIQNQIADDPIKLNKHKFTCKWPWSATYISVDGWVIPCCNIFDPGKINFGNIFSDDFREIWNCHRIRGLRSVIKKNNLPGVCARACSLDGPEN